MDKAAILKLVAEKYNTQPEASSKNILTTKFCGISAIENGMVC